MAMAVLPIQARPAAAIARSTPLPSAARCNAPASAFVPGASLTSREVFGDGVLRLRARGVNSMLATRRTARVMALFGLGVPELVVIAGVAALVFGPKKLPEIGKSLGKTVKSFQQAADEFQTELTAKKSAEEEEKVPGSSEETEAVKKTTAKENVEV
ncbi:sec-independent protein translocase protein TATA, chloroplastic [Selaginella moellendorffii]|uniref:sec-independent protein translocase protein TATA, chloroplastic n=1 Tax=Selaginella moellendorffii TaxID=88036 RepID=UPI000D1C93DE|nr:sec-independent protein translocase protein TATA, chloroplastic [Selaginella moellendorffii]|eukprot:XP_002987256.2 sec-independent protein translocase protein TATA, chloroplastic [Selaginella moellendorffii]